MKPLLLSLTAPPPEGFAHVPSPPVTLLRRGVFCLHSADREALLALLQPIADRVAGIAVAPAEAIAWRELSDGLYLLEAPADALPSIATRLGPMLSLIARARADRDAIRALSVDAERAARDRAELTREHMEFREAMFREIGERRAAERAVRESGERLRSVIAHAPVVFFVTDREGRFTLSEGRGLSRLGLHPGEVVGRAVAEVYRGFPRILACMARALAGESVREDVAVGPLVFDTLFSPLFDNKGYPSGVIGVATDITDRRRAEEERLELERQVQQTQKLESLGILAGGIAHDFNNLLTSVLANASLALTDLPEGSPARESLLDIETAGRRAADLCRQLLAYSGRGRFVVAPSDLGRLVREMVDLLGLTVSKNARLHLDIAGETPAVRVDETQFRQVVMNLVLNASEAIGDGPGDIRVAVRPVRLGMPEILASACPDETLPAGAYVLLEVSDTGCGMDEATRRRIFDPFFTTKFQGRGLGLAAVLGIVRSHRGVLSIESSPGAGTTFRVHLPASAEEARGETMRAARRAPEAFRGNGAVLLVDDEEVIRVPVKRMLERLGFGVIVACDGQEAVDLFRERGRGVVLALLDLTMPRMSGDRAFHILRERAPALPVVMMSGYSENDFSARFPGKAPDAFIQKPFDLATLESVCRAIFPLP